jgi:murein DD-endopeptidase MepM/ murein hydrolase activator NlpD
LRRASPTAPQPARFAVRDLAEDLSAGSPAGADAGKAFAGTPSGSGLSSLLSDISAFRLVALSSVRAAAFSPLGASPEVRPGLNWFHPPGLAGIEECPHCRASGSLISSGYGGIRYVSHRRRVIRIHHGIDIRAPQGSAALAFKGGEVIRAERHRTFGLMVEIRQYDGLVARYAHLDRILVVKGMELDAGTKVGKVGRTGRATGNHLHFELRREGRSVDPMIFLARVEQVMRCRELESFTRTARYPSPSP